MPMPKETPVKKVKVGMAFTEIIWLLPKVGIIEIIGGLLLIFTRTRVLVAIVILPVLTGILLANSSMAPSGLPIVFVLIAIILWVIIDNREKSLSMIRK